MAKAPQTAISPTRADDYPEWYQQVIKAADLAENSPVRGCMVIKPWGYAFWENMQRALDGMFKATGHENAYFPLFIPMSFLEKEAEHVEGFAKECAVVTHHRLEPEPGGGLQPAGRVGRAADRPADERNDHRRHVRQVGAVLPRPADSDQPVGQRRPLGTAHAAVPAHDRVPLARRAHGPRDGGGSDRRDDCRCSTSTPTSPKTGWRCRSSVGEKTPDERFPGAVDTLSIEAMMQDRKALQAGTSHFLGQNFAKAQEIKFQDTEGEQQYAWTTSWGVSTRLVGALIMTHSDDDGLVLPPRLAPTHIVILPIYRDDESRAAVLEYAGQLRDELRSSTFAGAAVRVEIDDRDIRGGEKKWHHVKRGVPIRIEIGPKDLQSQAMFVGRRDQPKSFSLPREGAAEKLVAMLGDIQQTLYDRAVQLRQDHTRVITNEQEFREFFTPANEAEPEIHGGFAICHFADHEVVQPLLKELKVTIRCIPRENNGPGTCFLTGQPAAKHAIFAKAY